MTLADCLEAAILEYGPMAECHLATAVRKRRQVVSAELERNPDRFIHNDLKARASRWDVRRRVVDESPSFTVDELVARWGADDDLQHWSPGDEEAARAIIFGRGGLVERGYLESVDGNGRVRVTELGRWKSLVLNGERP